MSQANSQKNVEAVERVYREINAHHTLPAELFDRECVTDLTQVSPENAILHSIDASQQALGSYFSTFENFHVAIEEVVHADEGRVVTKIRDGGRMRGSSAEIWSQFFHVWSFREGKVVRWSSYIDRAAALEAVGLPEQDARADSG